MSECSIEEDNSKLSIIEIVPKTLEAVVSALITYECDSIAKK